MNANSGAGFSSKSPYQASGAAAAQPSSLSKAGAGSLNTNIFNIPKYTGLGGGIGGGSGIGGGRGGGGIAGGLGRSSGIGSSGGLGSAGDNKQQEDNEIGGRYKF